MPLRRDPAVPAVARPCRFCRLYATAVLVIAAIMGGWTSVQFALDPAAPSLLSPLWRSLISATAPAASGTALTLALVLWARPLRPPELRAELPAVLKRAALVGLPGYLVAAGIALASGMAVLAAAVGARGVAGVGPADWLVGAISTIVDGALVLGLAWRFLGRLHASGISLPGALSVVVAVTVPVRATAALLLASLLSR